MGKRGDERKHDGGQDDRIDSAATPPHEGPDVYILTRQAVREVDRLAMEEFGIPSIVLMENAAFHLADVALHLTGEAGLPRILVVCGPGNNGGDGFAAARHLHNSGAEVAIVHAGPAKPASDAAINLAIAQKMGLPIERVKGDDGAGAIERAVAALGPPDLVIDALLGTGLDRAVREPALGMIARINDLGASGAQILAVDIPSGLDADTGEALGAAVTADVTVSFVGIKAGFTKLIAQEHIGDVVVADIGAPRELTARLGTLMDPQDPHESPEARPGHGPGGKPPPRRPDRG